MLIFLVGFMGSGKSYVCKHVTSLTGVAGVDMDHDIQDKVGMSIPEIFAIQGEDAFREEERKFLESLDANQDMMIATGGGAPCFGDNMELMIRKGIVIFLDRPRKEILERLIKGKHKRPLLADLSEVEIGNFYDKRMIERKTFYNKAQFRFSNQGVEDIAMIIRAMKL